MNSLSAQKQSIRNKVLAGRDNLDVAYRARASAGAIARLEPYIKPDLSISLYWPIRSEADPRGLIKTVRELGGLVMLPAVTGDGLEFRTFAHMEKLEPGPFGTFHPNAGNDVGYPDLIILPLVAFDRAGYRIGYGKGYFDRALSQLGAKHPQFRAVGLAFACQEVEAVPREAHDQPLHAIATEKELVVADRPV